jgi:hypothetical protein
MAWFYVGLIPVHRLHPLLSLRRPMVAAAHSQTPEVRCRLLVVETVFTWLDMVDGPGGSGISAISPSSVSIAVSLEAYKRW